MQETLTLTDRTPSTGGQWVNNLPPSVVHTHRFCLRLLQERDQSILISVGRRFASTPYRSTHEQSFTFHGCTMPRQCWILHARVLIKVAWLILRNSYLDVLTKNHIKQMLYTLPPNFINLRLLKTSRIGYGTQIRPWTKFSNVIDVFGCLGLYTS